MLTNRPPVAAHHHVLSDSEFILRMETGHQVVSQFAASRVRRAGMMVDLSPLCLPMGWTQRGRHLYALGGNEEAARLSGLSLGQLKATAYALAALLSSVVGILYAARQGQGDAGSAVGYELNAIAAAVVGGCSLRGGQGTITGTVLGVAFPTIVVNGIANVIKVDSTQWEGLVMGMVLIPAAAVNRLRKT
jgi:ribose/xylose/arabinose/galactoside ABC-type transport system permease subunit